MQVIPLPLREEMSEDQFYKKCSRNVLLHDHVCKPDPLTGKLIEWEHSMIYGGRQIQEKWAIIPVCWLVHRGGKLNKEINEWIALNRATPEDLAKYPKRDWVQRKKYLDGKYNPKTEGD